MVRWVVVSLAAAVIATAAPAVTAAPVASRPQVVAIVGDRGINPLHSEFATRDGRDPAYPQGMPTPVRVTLPTEGTFEERLAELQAGPLGSPVAGTLYAVAGTRLLVYATPGEDPPLLDRAHGTGTTSAAVGSRTGTAPDALAVLVLGSTPEAYHWLSEQRWIDLASLSVYTVRSLDPVCHNAAAGRALHDSGALLFASSGNTVDAAEPTFYPNGLPETYQVGGVDRTGRTWLPPRTESEEPMWAAGNVVRPYETGARFDFHAADSDSLDGSVQFGGTSGATPTVAGYATRLVADARRILGSVGARDGEVLARRGPGARPPVRGPLADGSFTREELVDLLHRSATPAETGAHRYVLEGFGATDDRSHALAVDVLHGRVELPQRPDDQSQHERAESLRALQSSRC